jgi:integrase
MPRKPNRPPLVCEFFTWQLFKRHGVFYADGRSGRYRLGKHSLGTRDQEEALAKLRLLDRQQAVQLGLATPSTATTAMPLTLPEGWQRYLAHCGRAEVLGGASAGTLKRYRAVQAKHVAFCERHGVRSWAEVDKSSAEKYGNWLNAKGYAHRTVYLELTLLKSAQGWLISAGLLPASCRFSLRLQKPEGTDTYCYSQAEVAAMVKHCRNAAALHWLAEVLVALACTGLRIGELAALRWTDLDAGCTTILLTDERASSRRQALGNVRTTKGRRDRWLPIHEDLRQVLLALPRHRDGRIFHGPRGGKVKPDTVRNILIRTVIEPLQKHYPTPAGEIGFEHGRVHSFRHYFCSQAFLAGAAEADIKEWLGHRDSKMVAHYRHLRSADSQRKMQQIDFLGPIDRTVRSEG